MDETPSPESSAPHHPAPAGWRPLSGLALTAFILSLVLVLPALGGYWWLQAVPALLGIGVFLWVKPQKRRGRLFGMFAALIALAVGFLGFQMHQVMRTSSATMADSVLTALDAQVSDEERDKALTPWLDEKVREGDRLSQIKARYAVVQGAVGRYTGEIDTGSIFATAFQFLHADGPSPGRDMEELGNPEGQVTLPLEGTLWLPARFEGGTVHIAITLGEGGLEAFQQALAKWQGRSPAAVIGDVRFFRPRE